MFKQKLSRVSLPHCKNTADMKPVNIEPVKEVVIPMSMHSGAPSVPIVSVGDHVYLGQKIAEAGEGTSVPCHATVSGKVTKIDVYPFNEKIQAITIESDGKMEKDPSMKPQEAKNLKEFLDVVKESGIVGLGGAAYPLWGKLAAAAKTHIKTFLVNGAECEPYLTGDTRTMVDDCELVKKGVELLKAYTRAEEFIIGIEENKPEAIKVMKETFKDHPEVQIKVLESLYPQGAKQVLLYNATGKVQAPGSRLADLGVLIINVTSLAKMAKHFETGMPLVDRVVTVDGSACKEPKNLIVPVGTPISYILEKAGGTTEDLAKVIIGGPMMGKGVADLNQPIVKATGGIIAFNKAESREYEPTPCIHCGKCVDACPLRLNPTAFAKAMELEDDKAKLEMLNREQVSLCMQCGCCSYVCPAHRPLVQTNVEALGFVKKNRAPRK